MKWPWSKEKEYVQQPEEYMSPEDLDEYMQGLDREAKAWRAARGTSRGLLEGRAGFGEPSTSTRYVSSEYETGSTRFSGAWKDFLVKYYYADSDAAKRDIFVKEVRRLMNQGHKLAYAYNMLSGVLAKHGLELPDLE